MADTVVQELKTVLSGESASFVQAMDKAVKANDGFIKKEREAQKTLQDRVGAVRRAFGGGGGGIVQGGADKLVSALKLSEKSAGIVGAGLGAAGVAAGLITKAFTASNALAGEQADKLAAMADDLRRSSRINLFATSADGFGTLSGQIAAEREKMQKLKELRAEVDPYGFGGGAVGTTATAIAGFQQAKTDALAGIPKGLRDLVGYAAMGAMPGPGYLVKRTLDQAGESGYSSFDREKDASDTLDAQEKVSAQTNARLARLASQSLAVRLSAAREGLSGSPEQARIMELRQQRRQEIAQAEFNGTGTDDNKSNIRRHYRTQIDATREQEDVRTRRAQVAQLNRGTMANGDLTDEQKRAKVTQANLAALKEELSTRKFLNAEQRAALEGERNAAMTDVKLSQADLAVSESQNTSAKKLASIRASVAGNAAKEYLSAREIDSALHEQLVALKGVNESRARGVELTIAQNQATMQEMRQGALMGKTPGAVSEMMFEQRKRQTRIQQFRDKDNKTDGLVNTEKDMAGNIISGIDPLTGLRRVPAAGMGRAEQGLTTGGLVTGGLSTSGTTGAMFGETSAAAALRGAPSAAGALAAMSGNPAFDPAARLSKGVIFPTLAGGGQSAGRTSMIMQQRMHAEAQTVRVQIRDELMKMANRKSAWDEF